MTRWWFSREPQADPLAFWGRLDQFRYVILVMAFTAATVLVLRTSPAWSAWQKFDLLRHAESVAASNKVTAANLELLTQACAKAPGRAPLLRALAIAAADVDPVLARRCYDRIVELRAGLPGDVPRRAALLVKLHDMEGARALLTQMPVDAVTTEVLLARLELNRASGDFAAALEALEELGKQNAVSLGICLDTAEAAMKGAAEERLVDALETRVVEAFERSAAAGRVDEIGSHALRFTLLPFRDPENRKRAVNVLGCLTSAPVEQRLAAVQFSLATSGADDAEIRRTCLAEIHRGWGLTVVEKERVATVLQQRHEHALVAEIISLPESLGEASLFRQRLESLLHLGRWKDAAAMGAAAPDRLPEKRYLLRCLAALHRTTTGSPEVILLVPEVLKEATETHSAPACYTLGCAALELKLGSLAVQAFRAALEQPSIDASMMEAILGAARAAGLDASATLRMLTRENAAAQSNAALKSRLCYLRLLAGKEVVAAQRDLESLASIGSNDPYVRFLHALDLHRRGDLVGACTWLAPLPPQRWQEGETAVIASIMGAANQLQQTASLMKRIDLLKLFPEERAMVAPWLARIDMEKNALSVFTGE